MGFGLDETEKLLKILILIFALIGIIAIIMKLNQTWGFLNSWKKAILCWAFGSPYC
jgi:hypothetical protein